MKQKKSQSTKKVRLITNHRGFTVIEIIIASSVLALLLTSLVGVFIFINQTLQFSGSKKEAVFLAEEGLEAVRNIRDEDFPNLVDGTHGLAISSNQWAFSGSEDITDGFTRHLEISTIDLNTKEVISVVDWQQRGILRTVSLITQLTNWALAAGFEADSLIVDATNAYILLQENKKLKGITIENTGSTEITIDKITLTWTKIQRKINEISIDNTVVWSKSGPGSPPKNQSSGTEIDIEDVVLAPGLGPVNIDYFGFTGNMKDNTFNIIFTMSDGSQQSVIGITPPLL